LGVKSAQSIVANDVLGVKHARHASLAKIKVFVPAGKVLAPLKRGYRGWAGMRFSLIDKGRVKRVIVLVR
jgi:hypothetical protein